jgi:hypothetical protein
MKKVLLAVLAAAGFSGAAFAGQLETAYSEGGRFYLPVPKLSQAAALIPPPPAPEIAPSTNYERRVDNPDGSVTFVTPMFSHINGKARISSVSDPNGACALYGASKHVASKRIWIAGVHDTPFIGVDGKLLKVEKLENPYVYEYLVCASSGAAPSRQYKALKTNDDGSVTIVEPRFDFLGLGYRSRISFVSDHNGVCRLFGYKKSVTAMRVDLQGIFDTPFIGPDGKLGMTKPFDCPYVYDYLVCAN